MAQGFEEGFKEGFKDASLKVGANVKEVSLKLLPWPKCTEVGYPSLGPWSMLGPSKKALGGVEGA